MLKVLVYAFALVVTTVTSALAQSFPPPGQVVAVDGIGSGGGAWSSGQTMTLTKPSARIEFITGNDPNATIYFTLDLTPIESQKIDQSTGQLIWTRAQCTATAADVVVSDGVALGYPAPPWPQTFVTWGGDPALLPGPATGAEAYDILTGSATVKVDTTYPYLDPNSAYGFYIVCIPPAGL